MEQPLAPTVCLVHCQAALLLLLNWRLCLATFVDIQPAGVIARLWDIAAKCRVRTNARGELLHGFGGLGPGLERQKGTIMVTQALCVLEQLRAGTLPAKLPHGQYQNTSFAASIIRIKTHLLQHSSSAMIPTVNKSALLMDLKFVIGVILIRL